MSLEWPQGSEVANVRRAWQDDDGHWWLVEFGLAGLRGRLECVSVALHPIRDEGDVTADLRALRATTMRQLPFDAVLSRARRERVRGLREMREWAGPETHLLGELGTAEKLFGETDAAAAKGRSKRDHRYLARVAGVYQAAFEEGESAPSKRVEQEFGLTSNVARKLVQRCRRSGLLPPATGTKPRGWLAGEREDSEDGGTP